MIVSDMLSSMFTWIERITVLLFCIFIPDWRFSVLNLHNINIKRKEILTQSHTRQFDNTWTEPSCSTYKIARLNWDKPESLLIIKQTCLFVFYPCKWNIFGSKTAGKKPQVWRCQFGLWENVTGIIKKCIISCCSSISVTLISSYGHFVLSFVLRHSAWSVDEVTWVQFSLICLQKCHLYMNKLVL